MRGRNRNCDNHIWRLGRSRPARPAVGTRGCRQWDFLVLTSVGTEPEPAADQTAGHQVLITYVSAYIGKAFVGAGQACLAWGLAVCVTLLF